MRTIWKFECTLDDFALQLPPLGDRRAQFLSVQNQNGKPVVWFVVDDGYEPHERRFRCVMTGESMPALVGVDDYLGTVQIDRIVLHLFEVYS